MKCGPWVSACLLLAAALSAGCTSLREIPRSDYASRPERKNVRLQTRDGLVYEFDFVQVQGDSIVGFRQRDTVGAFEEFGSVRVALREVQSLSARTLDWYRTGLIGGGVVVAVVVAGLSTSSETTSGSSGGTGPRDGP